VYQCFSYRPRIGAEGAGAEGTWLAGKVSHHFSEVNAMTPLLTRLSPSITDMIRMDHTHVVAVFHRFKSGVSAHRKSALVRNACMAIEVHAQLEEEIFYPALRACAGPDPVLDRSTPEHDEMRALIARLRRMDPDDPELDSTFLGLMRTVLHHVADEESVLLPEAERRMGEQLSELGAQMTRRRMELIAPHAGELAVTSAQAFPVMSVLAVVSALLLGSLLLRRGEHQMA
jgi:hemerythrin superfamily protein